MPDIEVTRLVADVTTDGGAQTVAEMEAIAAAEDEAAKDRTGHLRIETGDSMAKIAAVRGAMSGLHDQVATVRTSISDVTSSIPGLVTGVSGGAGGGIVPLPAPGGGRRTGAPSPGEMQGYLAKAFSDYAKGAPKGPLSFLGFGQGKFGLPGFGSIGSLAGFGLEHFALTGLGIGGLAVAGAAGGAALGATSLATAGVGGLTDAMASKQALMNVQSVTKAMTAQQQVALQYGSIPALLQKMLTAQANYNQTVLKFGAGSQQALLAQQQLTQAQGQYQAAMSASTQATQQLNLALANVNPVARQAVTGAASAWEQLKANFKQLTGPGVATAAGTITQALHVAGNMMPTLATFANQNMVIIQKALQPFFSWLQGPGLGFIVTLEKKFQQDLPTSISVFTNAIELLLHIFAELSGQTGGFMKHLDEWLIRANSPEGFAKVMKHLDNWIADFHVIMDFAKILFKDLAAIFHLDAGTATAIVEQLTGALQRLHQWITGPGRNILQHLFEVHKTEALQLLKVLEDLLVNFGGAYLVVAPALVGFANNILSIANAFFRMSATTPVLRELVPFLLFFIVLESRTKVLTGTIMGLVGAFKAVSTIPKAASAATGVGDFFASLGGGGTLGIKKEAERQLAIDEMKKQLSGVGAVGDASKAKGFFKTISDGAKSAGQAVWDFAKKLGVAAVGALAALGEMAAGMIGVEIESVALNAALGAGVIGAVVLLGLAIYELVKHWNTVWADIKKVFDDAVKFLRSGFGTLVLLLLGPIGDLLILALHWKQIWADMKIAVNDFVGFFMGIGHWFKETFDTITHFFESWWDRIKKDFENWIKDAENFGKHLVEGILHGVESIPILGPMVKFGASLIGHLKNVFGIFSPAAATIPIGQSLGDGITQGLIDSSKGAADAADKIAQAINASFKNIGGTSNAKQTMQNLADVFTSLSKMFQALNTAAQAAPQASSDMFAISATLYSIGGEIQKVISGMQALNTMWSQAVFQNTAGGENFSYGAKGFVGMFGTISKFFNDLKDAWRASGSLKPGDLFFLEASIYSMGSELPKIMGGINAINEMFSGALEGNPKEKDLSFGVVAFNAMFGHLAFFFNDLQTLVRASRNIKPGDMFELEATLYSMGAILPKIMSGINSINLMFSGALEGNPKEQNLTSGLQSFNAIFGHITTFFNDLEATAKNSANLKAGDVAMLQATLYSMGTVIPQMMKGIDAINTMWAGAVMQNPSGKDFTVGINAYINLFNNLGRLFDAVQRAGSAAGGMNSANSIVVALNSIDTTVNRFMSHTMFPHMEQWGEQMVTSLTQGIEAGVTKNKPALTMAGLAAGGTLGSAVTAGATLTTNYYIEGVNVGANNPAQFAQMMAQQSRLANATGGSKRAG